MRLLGKLTYAARQDLLSRMDPAVVPDKIRNKGEREIAPGLKEKELEQIFEQILQENKEWLNRIWLGYQ